MLTFRWRQCCAAALLLVAHQAALAHAHPLTMQPAADSVVSAPTSITIHFSEALEPALSTLEVQDATGQKVGNAHATVSQSSPSSMQLSLPALRAGRYSVHWVAVADDGHRTHGSYAFQVK